MSPSKTESIEQRGINLVRILSADAVQKANSGHPGTPMGLAAIGHVLWAEAMRFNPKDTHWPNRDRFILSAGHACMLQYSYLFLTGYPITLNDIHQFRQLHSKTPGHPEYGLLEGIEVTTGPLGQGFGNGVGMSIAQKFLSSRYNRPGFLLFDYFIYVICSDGDMMEGVSSESASLAGHLKLGNLIYIYDDNHISIEGNTDITFNEDVAARFEAYHWHVQVLPDGNDIAAIADAIEKAKQVADKPSLIKIRTHIGYGSPGKVDTAEAHGSPLGVEELKLVKKNFGYDPEQSFVIPEDILHYYREKGKRSIPAYEDWKKMKMDYARQFPELAREYELFSNGTLPIGWQEKLPVFTGPEKIATRKAFGQALNSIADFFPLLIGGAADLSPSTDTMVKNAASFSAEHYEARNFHFGVREHGMGAVLNGMALTPGIRPYGASFLIFSDYMRPPIRLAAIMGLGPVYVFTHDSIGLGEDGTTHQPVEQLMSLRAIPHVTVIRPADANETIQALKTTLEYKGGPVALILSRQTLPVIDQQKYSPATSLPRGAYILSDCEGTPDILLIGTGSEVHLLLEVQEKLKLENFAVRVISMPSWEFFEKQDPAYKEKIFPSSIRKRISVEAGATLGWCRYITEEGYAIGLDHFGASAPAAQLMEAFGFTVRHIVEKARALIGK